MRSKQGRNRVTEICTARIFPGWKQIRGFIWHPHITWEMADQCPMVPRCRWIIRHTCRKNTGGKKHSVHCEWHRLPWQGRRRQFRFPTGTRNPILASQLLRFSPHFPCEKGPENTKKPRTTRSDKTRQGSSTQGYANSMDSLILWSLILENLLSWNLKSHV